MINPKTDTQPRTQKNRIGLIRSIVFLLILIALWSVFSIQGRGPTVTNVVMATALDDQYRPVHITQIYRPTDLFAVSVEVKNYRSNDPLVARWLYEGGEIDRTPLSSDLTGNIHAGFVLQNSNLPWPIGKYRVEILYNASVLGSADFIVEQ